MYALIILAEEKYTQTAAHDTKVSTFASNMISVKFLSCVFFLLIFGHDVAAEFVSKAEFESLQRRVDNLEASLGKYEIHYYSTSVQFQSKFLLLTRQSSCVTVRGVPPAA